MSQINISNLIAVPILSEPVSDYMWTGMVKAENITSLIIEDDKSREEFTKMLKDLEASTREYRELAFQSKSNTKVLQVNTMSKQESLFEMSRIHKHIEELSKDIVDWLANPVVHDIDAELIWIELCREYEDMLEKNPNELKSMSKQDRKTLEELRTYYTTLEPVTRDLYLHENKYACFQFPTRYQEKKFLRGGKDNKDKLSEILRSIEGKEELTSEEEMNVLKELVEGINALDLSVLFTTPRFGKRQYIAHLKNYLLEKGYDFETIEQMSNEQVRNVVAGYYNNDTLDFHSTIMANTIMDNIEYINLDKFLLLSMCRPLEAFNVKDLDTIVEEARENIQVAQGSLDISEDERSFGNEDTSEELESGNSKISLAIAKTRRIEHIIKKILETGIVSPKTKFSIGTGEREKEYSLKKLNELMKYYCDGIYLNEIMEANLIYSLYESQDAMSDWSDELIKRLEFSMDNKMVVATMNFSNLQRLYALGKIDKSDIREILQEIYFDDRDGVLDEVVADPNSINSIVRQNSKNLLKNLYNSGIIDESEIVQYIEDGIVTNRMLETLEEGKNKEELDVFYRNMRDALGQERILRKYNEYVKKYIEFTTLQAENPGATERIEELREEANDLIKEKNSFRELFLKYHSNMTNSEKHLLGESLLEEYYIEMDVTDEEILQETISVLYEDGLIDLENIIGLDKKYIIPMLDKLSLEDASKIRNGMNFEELTDLLDNIFSDDEFSDERRFIIVMNLLGEDTEEDKSAREFYLSLLDFEEGSERKGKQTGNKKNFTGEGTKESNKYIYPDFVKWKFYKGLDKDVRVTRYSNGFVEFASAKLGSRIIEKYYDGNKPAYGTATYILSEEQYRDNESELITITPTGTIFESATLREITPRKDRIAHRTQSKDRTWMDDIIRYFDIDFERENDSRYTPEELKTLQEIVEKYKTQYEQIK